MREPVLSNDEHMNFGKKCQLFVKTLFVIALHTVRKVLKCRHLHLSYIFRSIFCVSRNRTNELEVYKKCATRTEISYNLVSIIQVEYCHLEKKPDNNIEYLIKIQPIFITLSQICVAICLAISYL